MVASYFDLFSLLLLYLNATLAYINIYVVYIFLLLIYLLSLGFHLLFCFVTRFLLVKNLDLILLLYLLFLKPI